MRNWKNRKTDGAAIGTDKEDAVANCGFLDVNQLDNDIMSYCHMNEFRFIL
jgi:hypothetical protein